MKGAPSSAILNVGSSAPSKSGSAVALAKSATSRVTDLGCRLGLTKILCLNAKNAAVSTIIAKVPSERAPTIDIRYRWKNETSIGLGAAAVGGKVGATVRTLVGIS